MWRTLYDFRNWQNYWFVHFKRLACQIVCWSLSLARWRQSISSHFVSLRSTFVILLISPWIPTWHLPLKCSDSHFLCLSHLSHAHSMPQTFTLLHFITKIMSVEGYALKWDKKRYVYKYQGTGICNYINGLMRLLIFLCPLLFHGLTAPLDQILHIVKVFEITDTPHW